MPLYSYKCDDCEEYATEMLLKVPLKQIKCPVCGGRMTRRFKPFRVLTHGITTRGRFVSGLGRFVDDTSEYNKEMKKHGLIDVSQKELEAEQARISRNNRDAADKAVKEAKEDILNDPKFKEMTKGVS